MAPRVTYKRRHAYNTRSNKIMKKRLPGGRLGIAYVKKTTKGAQTPSGDNGRIHGVRARSRASDAALEFSSVSSSRSTALSSGRGRRERAMIRARGYALGL